MAALDEVELVFCEGEVGFFLFSAARSIQGLIYVLVLRSHLSHVIPDLVMCTGVCSCRGTQAGSYDCPCCGRVADMRFRTLQRFDLLAQKVCP